LENSSEETPADVVSQRRGSALFNSGTESSGLSGAWQNAWKSLLNSINAEIPMLNKKMLWCSVALAIAGATAVLALATNARSSLRRFDPEEFEMRRANTYASTGSCGVERWSVKTGTDADAHLVNLSSPTSQTISYLRSLTAPSTLPANNRVQPTETTSFMVNATLVEYKLESDSDYHLVIKDSAGNTMIAEIPDPACVGSTSPFSSYVHNSRSEFDAKYSATTSFQTVNIPVRLFGVGFFDFQHGQTGVAPNAIELHPVLDIVFNPSSNSPPVANFGYVANGLTASFTDTSTDSDGTIASRAWTFGDGGTSTAANPTHTYAAAGSYNVSLKVTDNGGATNTKTQSVAVSSGGTAQQLLGNPGFENGSGSPAPWTVSTGVIDNSSAEAAHAGSWKAWLDGYGSTHTDTLSQAATIPATDTSASLSYWLHIDTAEASTSSAYDTLKVEVFDSAGNLLGVVAQYSNLNAASGYKQYTVDLHAYIGKSITLKFLGAEDSTLQTSFVLDDVTLNVK
jgi:PKD repeat protein